MPMNTMNPKSGVPETTLILLLAILLLPAKLPAEAVRSAIENMPGVVTITATPPAGTAAYAVEEILPVSAFARRISHNGVFDPQTNKVKWGPFYDDVPRGLTFEVSIGNDDLALVGSMSHDDSGPIPTTGIEEIDLPDFETYFAGWQNRYLPVNTPLLSADYLFPGSSMPLLLQYAMGLKPGSGGSPLEIMRPDHPEGALRYLRDLRRADISLQLQSSEDLVEWINWDPPSVELELIDEFKEVLRVPLREDVPFYRIRAFISQDN